MLRFSVSQKIGKNNGLDTLIEAELINQAPTNEIGSLN